MSKEEKSDGEAKKKQIIGLMEIVILCSRNGV
jgi:hypothetical protein